MQNLQIYKRELSNDDSDLKNSNHKYYPISFIREVKFFFDISYDEVNQLLIEVEKIKESKKQRLKNLKKLNSLTVKEREVFDLVVKGLSTKEIAKKLFIQDTTISTHRKHIKQKMEFETLYEWFLFAKSIQ